MVKRIGLIDLRSGPREGDQQATPAAGEVYQIHLFKASSGRYELEESLGPFSLQSSFPSPSLVAGVKEFYLSLPLARLDFRVLKLPFSDRDRLREVIPFELEGLILPPVGEIAFDVLVLEERDSASEVLVAFAEAERIRAILERLNSLSLDPRVITCLELCLLIQQRGMEDFALRLLEPGEVDVGSEDRIRAAQQEVLSPTINLRIGPLAHTKEAEKTERALRILGVLSISLALLINAHLVAKAAMAKKEGSAIRSEMRAQYAALFPQQKNISDELYLLKSHMKEFQDKREALTDVDLLQLLMDLSEKNIPGITFHEVTVEKTLITVKGETPSANEIEKVKTNLEPSLEEISISEMKPSGAGRFLFAMMAKGRKR